MFFHHLRRRLPLKAFPRPAVDEMAGPLFPGKMPIAHKPFCDVAWQLHPTQGLVGFFHKRLTLHLNGKFVSFPNSIRLAIKIIKAWKIQAVSFGISFLGLTLRPYLRLGFLFQVLPSDHIHQEVSLLMRR